MLQAAPRLWRKYFCVRLQTNVNETCECGGANIINIVGVNYLEGTFVETNKNWQEKWFYIPDVPLEDPVRTGIVTPFTPTPP